MIKISVLGIAVVAAATAFDAPAFAQHRAGHIAASYAQGYAPVGVCGYQEPGNPYSREEDYIAWSAWRARGGWDDRPDTSCLGRRGF